MESTTSAVPPPLPYSFPSRHTRAAPPDRSRRGLWLGIACFLIGVALGFLLKPDASGPDANTPTETADAPVLKSNLVRRLGLAGMPVPHQPWTNGLGITFSPAPDGSLVAATALRYRDFEAFVDETSYQTSGFGWIHYNTGWERRPGYDWRYGGASNNDYAPVTTLEPTDAAAFCEWLTRREHELGWLKSAQSYQTTPEASPTPGGPSAYRLTLVTGS